jgi:hypothetical protein
MKTEGFNLKDFVIAFILGLIIPPLPFVVGFIFFNWNFVGDDVALFFLLFLYAINTALLTHQLYVYIQAPNLKRVFKMNL